MHKATYFIFTFSFPDILELLNISWTLTKKYNTDKAIVAKKQNKTKQNNRLIGILALGFDSKDCSLPLCLLRGRCGSLFGFIGTRVQRLAWILVGVVYSLTDLRTTLRR